MTQKAPAFTRKCKTELFKLLFKSLWKNVQMTFSSFAISAAYKGSCHDE